MLVPTITPKVRIFPIFSKQKSWKCHFYPEIHQAESHLCSMSWAIRSCAGLCAALSPSSSSRLYSHEYPLGQFFDFSGCSELCRQWLRWWRVWAYHQKMGTGHGKISHLSSGRRGILMSLCAVMSPLRVSQSSFRFIWVRYLYAEMMDLDISDGFVVSCFTFSLISELWYFPVDCLFWLQV